MVPSLRSGFLVFVGQNFGLTPIIQGSTIPSRIEEVNQLISSRDELLADLRHNLLQSQDLMRSYANKYRRYVEYAVGDWVFLKMQPYRRKSLVKRLNEKLGPRFYGPFQVLEKVGGVAYKLDLPSHSRIHPVCHVSLLKKAVVDSFQSQPLPTMLSEEHELLVYPEFVLDIPETAPGDVEVFIQWQHLSSCENSWEYASRIREAFPD